MGAWPEPATSALSPDELATALRVPLGQPPVRGVDHNGAVPVRALVDAYGARLGGTALGHEACDRRRLLVVVAKPRFCSARVRSRALGGCDVESCKRRGLVVGAHVVGLRP